MRRVLRGAGDRHQLRQPIAKTVAVEERQRASDRALPGCHGAAPPDLPGHSTTRVGARYSAPAQGRGLAMTEALERELSALSTAARRYDARHRRIPRVTWPDGKRMAVNFTADFD